MSKQNGDRHSTDIQPSAIEPEQLTAFALGQMHGDELAAVKAAVGEAVNSAAHDEVREVQALAAAITAARNAEPLPKPSVELRSAIERKLDEQGAGEAAAEKVTLAAQPKRGWRPTIVEWSILGGICCLLVALFVPAAYVSLRSARQSARTVARIEQGASQALKRTFVDGDQLPTASSAPSQGYNRTLGPSDTTADDSVTMMVTPRIIVQETGESIAPVSDQPAQQYAKGHKFAVPVSESAVPDAGTVQLGGARTAPSRQTAGATGMGAGSGGPAAVAGGGQAGGYPGSSGPSTGYNTIDEGRGYSGSVSGSGKFGPGFANNPVPGTASESAADVAELAKRREDLRQGGLNYQLSKRSNNGESETRKYRNQSEREVAVGNTWEYDGFQRQSGREFAYGDHVGNEQYEPIVENQFLAPTANPLSTFSIDVDTASYANVRRFLNEGRLPPPSAVRIEELVNYFNYSYPQPAGKEPFSVNMEAAECPWNAGHLLLRVGLKGKEIHRSERPPSNLTFLLDVSGSMADANKLPLLKATLMMFVAELSENDRVSIVTYAGDAGLRLPPTLGHEKAKIMAAIDSLSAGGSTHGSAGIQLAYEQAGQYFLKEGTNRVILATDGDLNVGITGDDALVQLIKEKAAGGTFLTVLGFGTGNLKDGKLEKLADNGNGVYAYIDGFREGRKVLVEQMSGSMVTIAKDVKIQIEFNPAQIASYRLLGYENRVLAAEDFNNDKKDAGEIGAGHTVTALYELVPVGLKQDAAASQPAGEPLKYQATGAGGQEPGGQRSEVRGQANSRLTDAAATGELLTLKLRYKEPDGVESRLVEFPLKDRGGKFNGASQDLQFAAAVASFGMILRGSEHRGTGNLPAVAEIASGAIGSDPSGYRAEFVDLVRKAQSLGAK